MPIDRKRQYGKTHASPDSRYCVAVQRLSPDDDARCTTPVRVGLFHKNPDGTRGQILRSLNVGNDYSAETVLFAASWGSNERPCELVGLMPTDMPTLQSMLAEVSLFHRQVAYGPNGAWRLVEPFPELTTCQSAEAQAS